MTGRRMKGSERFMTSASAAGRGRLGRAARSSTRTLPPGVTPIWPIGDDPLAGA